MAEYLGNDGVWQLKPVGSGTLTSAGELLEYSISETGAVIDTTAKGATWTTNTPGRKSWRGSAKLKLDDAASQQLSLRAGTQLEMKFWPTGTSGVSRAGTATIEDRSEVSVDGDGVCSLDVSFVGDGELTFAAAL